MKKIYMLGIALLAGTMSFAQQATNTTIKKEYNSLEKVPQSNQINGHNKAILWSDDMSNSSNWIVTNDNTGGQMAEWGFSTNPAEIPVSILSPFESETADNGFLFISSDANNSTDGAGTIINTTATTNTTIDLTGYPNVLLTFSHNYRWWHDNRSVRVSGDGGATYTEFQITDQDGYDLGLSSGEQNSGNPQIESIDISAIAGGQSDVKIQFVYNDNDIWAWYWAVDDVSILEKPANDIQLSYSVVSPNPSEFIEYGRVPIDQLDNGMSLSVNVFNFGAADQTNIVVTAEFTNGTTTINETATVASLATGENIDIDLPIQQNLTLGIYEGTFTVTSAEEPDGDFFDNNVDSRKFEITDGLYSEDGINVYEPLELDELGPGMFAPDGDTTSYISGDMLTEYDLRGESSVVTGVRVLLSSNGNSEGSLIFSYIVDTAAVSAGDLGNKLTQSDLYTVTATDVTNGYVDLMFSEATTLAGNSYYAGVRVEDGVGFRILDDVTIPQPAMSSVLSLDGVVYTNGMALAIQLYVSWIDGVDELVANDFTLSQNTPNPANNSTVINYHLTNSNSVSLNIVDITGKIVKTINEGKQAAGSHSITLDVKDLSAGVYTYTLNVGANQITRRMIIE